MRIRSASSIRSPASGSTCPQSRLPTSLPCSHGLWHRSAVTFPADLVIRLSVVADVPEILAFIRELAAYEKLSDEVVADEASLKATLFVRPAAEVLIAELGGVPV